MLRPKFSVTRMVLIDLGEAKSRGLSFLEDQFWDRPEVYAIGFRHLSGAKLTKSLKRCGSPQRSPRRDGLPSVPGRMGR